MPYAAMGDASSWGNEGGGGIGGLLNLMGSRNFNTSSGSAGGNTTTKKERVENFDPQSLALLQAFVGTLNSGGTENQKAQRVSRDTTTNSTRALLADYAKSAAFQDAQALVERSLQESMQKNMPAIQRSVEGAGTSASAMQGLLSQQLATNATREAAALGAEQAKAYGGISAQLSSVLANLAGQGNDVENNLLQALQVLKGGVVNSESSVTAPEAQGGAGRGGFSAGGGGGGGGVRTTGGGGGGGGYIAYPDNNYISSQPKVVPQSLASLAEQAMRKQSNPQAAVDEPWTIYKQPTVGGEVDNNDYTQDYSSPGYN